MNARLCLKELQKLMDPIEKYGAYIPHPPTYSEKESLLVTNHALYHTLDGILEESTGLGRIKRARIGREGAHRPDPIRLQQLLINDASLPHLLDQRRRLSQI